MYYNIFYIILLFLMYSFFGYLVEVTAVLLNQKKLVLERGFLIGPYLPIFGSGAFIMLYALEKYKNDMFVLVIASFILCGILEYFTSLIMEKIYGFRWWDYSDKKFNVNGRICLEYLLYFGLSSILIVKFINPIVIKFLNFLPNEVIIISGITMSIVIIIDLIASINAANNLKEKLDVNKLKFKDSTKEIKEEIKKQLSSYNLLNKRLINSFPEIKKRVAILQKQIKKRKIK